MHGAIVLWDTNNCLVPRCTGSQRICSFEWLNFCMDLLYIGRLTKKEKLRLPVVAVVVSIFD